MLHEALMALGGFPGDLFNTGDEMAEFLSFLHPGEKALLDRILHIASDYRSLVLFIEMNMCQIGMQDISLEDDVQSEESPPEQPNGNYVQAFCNALNEVLEPYRIDIAELEKEALNDPLLPLTFVVYRVEKYSALFYVLNIMIRQIMIENIRGCQILGFVYRHLSSGAESVKVAIKHILHGCHAVFFKQLSSWLLYGQLTDPYKEFIIQRVVKSPSPMALSIVKSEISRDSESTHVLDHRNLYPAFCDYAIDFNKLPPYIAASLAYKILFVGQTILMFGSDPRDKKEMATITHKRLVSIWGGREEEFFIKLQQLQAMEKFNLTSFEKTIEEIRSCVTKHLWQLAIEEAHLSEQLKLMKDFFLLGRGELFLEFIRQAGPILVKTPSSTSNRDVNQAFQIAARKVLLNDEAALDKFYFSLPGKDENGSENYSEVPGWQCLSLNYKVSWPLHLLFCPEVLDNYNHLFGFLLHVKKIQYDLHNVWNNQMQDKLLTRSVSDTEVWQLRNNLMFLIDNLQYYLQVDVLEGQYMQLQNTLHSTKDFEKVQQAHTIFQTNVLSQTFILMGKVKREDKKFLHVPTDKTSGFKANPVHRCLNSFLSLCETFSAKISVWKNPLDEEQQNELSAMSAEFKSVLKFLMQLLSSLRSQPCGTHLSQLLLRLDFNRWFSRLHNMSTSVTHI